MSTTWVTCTVGDFELPQSSLAYEVELIQGQDKEGGQRDGNRRVGRSPSLPGRALVKGSH